MHDHDRLRWVLERGTILFGGVLFAVLLHGCRVHRVVIGPPTPPDDPPPMVVTPDPQEPLPVDPRDPTGCRRACERYDFMGCDPPIERCVDYCERSESLGAAYSMHPECGARAVSCMEWDDCATGVR